MPVRGTQKDAPIEWQEGDILDSLLFGYSQIVSPGPALFHPGRSAAPFDQSTVKSSPDNASLRQATLHTVQVRPMMRPGFDKPDLYNKLIRVT